jgi:proteasome lid subunit RPN8/RPN11
MDALTLSREQFRQITAQLQAAWPEEACGLLGGPRGGPVLRVYAVENIRHSPTAYEMEPHQQVRAMIEIEDAGWEILAIYHSHPHGPAAPSETDIAQAYYPDSLYLICAPSLDGAWAARAYRIAAGKAAEAALNITE